MRSALLLQIFITLCSFVIYSSANDACEDVQIQSCDACIQAHPSCAWCLESSEPNANIKRCRSLEKFRAEGTCKDLNASLENPKSSVSMPQNEELSDPDNKGENLVQLKPQKIHLTLRKGETKKFRITYRKVSDYPVDLYYVMDLSNSMKDDLATLKNLGIELAEKISNVTENVQLGFGTFVDKVMMPFASTVPEQLNNPCFKNQDGGVCAPPFGFKHQQKISENKELFREAVTSTVISGNIDSPEGGFDALMQIAVCTEEIGWRNESTHLVVFTTDASFHMALDGKLAAILEMNDMKCHLQKGLRQLIPNSHVDQLANDSSNIINIITDAYNKLRGKLEMTWTDKPKEISMEYRVLCPNEDWKEQSLKCENISIGSNTIFEFEVTANDCPTGELFPMLFSSSSLQESVAISFSFQCGCDCSEARMYNDSKCKHSGDLVCGICQCDDQHEGARCQCARDEKDVSVLDKCKMEKTLDVYCENNGECQCGNCSCNDGYSGPFCQCSNKGCPKDDEQLQCGGSDKGSCKNCLNSPKCICENGWSLDEKLQTCTCHPKLCFAQNDTKQCSGHGNCSCNQCECDANGHYSGKYCETCVHPDCKDIGPTCTGKESKFVACAICVNQAQTKGKNVKEECREDCANIQKLSVAQIPDCKTCKDGDDCYGTCKRINTDISESVECKTPLPQSECDIVFEVVWFREHEDFGILVKDFNKETDCREPMNPILIVLPIVAGIVLIGLLLLVAWKIYQTIRDKKEYENFQKDMKNSKWTKDINPVFVNPSATFENPAYGGGEM